MGPDGPMTDSENSKGGSPTGGLTERFERRLGEGRVDLPLLPSAASQVLGLCQDPDADARSLAGLIQSDQALTAHVLRVANSAAYMPLVPIVSLQQAIGRLGLATLAEIAIAVAMKGRVFDVPGYEGLAQELWLHSVVTAGVAREIARLRRANVEGAFLSGLIHDVGRPVVLQGVLDLAEEVDEEVDEAELFEAMDRLHPGVGAMLIAQWGLPEWMAAAALCHHEPESTEAHGDYARTAWLADRLAHGDDIDYTVVAPLGLYSDDVELLKEKLESFAETAEAYA